MPAKCKDSNCTGKKQAVYGYETDYKAIRCKECKTNDMINVKDKKCQNCFENFYSLFDVFT